MAPIPIYNFYQTNINKNSSSIVPIDVYNTKTVKTSHISKHARYIFPKSDHSINSNWIVNDIPHEKTLVNLINLYSNRIPQNLVKEWCFIMSKNVEQPEISKLGCPQTLQKENQNNNQV